MGSRALQFYRIVVDRARFNEAFVRSIALRTYYQIRTMVLRARRTCETIQKATGSEAHRTGDSQAVGVRPLSYYARRRAGEDRLKAELPAHGAERSISEGGA